MDSSIIEFLGQIGPEYMQYLDVFVQNEFRDASSLRAINVETDLDLMFGDDLKLAHKRKLQMALRNLIAAHGGDLPVATCSNATFESKSIEPIHATTSNLGKIQNNLKSTLKKNKKEK